MAKATVLAILTKSENGEEKVLLTRRNIPPYQGQWCLPGGHIDSNEKAQDAIIREVREEVGLDFDAVFFDYFDEVIPEEEIHAVVLAFKGAGKGEMDPDAREVSEIKWVSIIDALIENLAFNHRSILVAFLKNKEANIEDKAGYVQELNYLRSEILNRFGERNKVLHYNILLAGLFLGLSKNGFTDYTLLLIYPLLGTFLAMLWSHNDIRIYQIGKYIKENIEPHVNGLNWQNKTVETYHKQNQSFLFKKLQEWSVLGIFIFSFLLTIFLAITDSAFDIEDRLTQVLLGIDVLALIITWVYIRKRRKDYKKENDPAGKKKL